MAELRAALADAAGRYLAALEDLTGPAQELAALEGQLRAAENQGGIFNDLKPPARELAAEVLHGRLGCLRPHLPMVTAESAERAAEALMYAPRPPLGGGRHKESGASACGRGRSSACPGWTEEGST